MAIDFPATPTLDQEVTLNGTVWVCINATGPVWARKETNLKLDGSLAMTDDLTLDGFDQSLSVAEAAISKGYAAGIYLPKANGTATDAFTIANAAGNADLILNANNSPIVTLRASESTDAVTIFNSVTSRTTTFNSDGTITLDASAAPDSTKDQDLITVKYAADNLSSAVGKVWNVADHLTANQLVGTADCYADLQTLATNIGTAGGTSGVIYIPANVTLLISADVTLPSNVSLVGEAVMGAYHNVHTSRITSSGGAIILGAVNSGVRGVNFLRQGASTGATTLINYLDEAIKIGNCTSAKIDNVNIWGFNIGIDASDTVAAGDSPRLSISNSTIDCKYAITIDNSQKYVRLTNVNGTTNLGNPITSGTVGALRETFINIGTTTASENVIIENCYCDSYKLGIYVKNSEKIIVSNCKTNINTTDDAYTGSGGIFIDTTNNTNSCSVVISGFSFNGGVYPGYFNLKGLRSSNLDNLTTISGSVFSNGKTALIWSYGDIIVSGSFLGVLDNQTIKPTYGITMDAPATANDKGYATITGCVFQNVTTSINHVNANMDKTNSFANCLNNAGVEIAGVWVGSSVQQV